MSARPIQIGQRRYASVSLAAMEIRTVLYSYEPGTSTVTPAHERFLRDVLDRHPESAQKIGCGVASFQVESNGGSRGFWLTRHDGTRTDWSFLACLTAPTAEQQALAGFRAAARPQIDSFRDECFARGKPPICPVTRERLTRKTAHVDHEIPFDSLVKTFLGPTALRDVRVEPTRDDATETMLADRVLREAWALYHRSVAKLRLVSAQANLSALRRQR